MNKAISLILLLLSLALLFVSCSSDSSVDEAFNCTVTFDGNGATEGEMSAQTIGIGIPTKLNANTFVKTDLDFAGWTTKSDGSGTLYSDGQIASITKNTILYAQWGDLLSEETTAWTDSQTYFSDRNLMIAGRITVSGNVTLLLLDGCTLTASEGISVNEGNSLTINALGKGTGTLIDTGPNRDAGIGGNSGSNGGTVIINGGTVNVTGGGEAAGIGGGFEGVGGTITINGGNVISTGGHYGSGIGGGNYKSGGTTTINNGTVVADGGYGAAGIGGGTFGDGGIITINGGNVTASSSQSGSNAAGIGGGGNASGGTITINGGKVVAVGGSFSSEGKKPSGIGGDYDNPTSGTLTIGGNVSLEVSSDNESWSDYDGTTRQRYMRTK